MSDYSVFTSESVGEGHPDKLADQISDAILDAMLEQDPDSRVACETLIKTGMVVLAGEIRSSASVDVDKLVRQVIADVPPQQTPHSHCNLVAWQVMNSPGGTGNSSYFEPQTTYTSQNCVLTC